MNGLSVTLLINWFTLRTFSLCLSFEVVYCAACLGASALAGAVIASLVHEQYHAYSVKRSVGFQYRVPLGNHICCL